MSNATIPVTAWAYEVVLQNRSSFFLLAMPQNLLCCSGIAAPAVLQNQLCDKTTCAANVTPATLCVDRQLVEFQHRLIGKTRLQCTRL